MKAIVQERYGSPDVLELREVDRPVPAAGEVLVRVHAAAVNASDWHVMRGDPMLARLALPAVFGRTGPKNKIRGRDFAGRVEAVGAQVSGFRPGDEVYGDLGFADGAFAEYVGVPATAVAAKPSTLSFEQAAAMPLAASTALLGLRDTGRVQPGQQVLVNGASGGVGTFAVQLAKAFGATVTGVCSPRNVELVRSLGADHVVDYTSADFAAGPQRYDLVFDLVGNRSLGDLRRALTPAGTLVLSGGGVHKARTTLVGPMGLRIMAQAQSRFVKHRIVELNATPSSDTLATLAQLADSGQVTPVIDRTYPLPETPAAIRYLEQEHARAKVVITL